MARRPEAPCTPAQEAGATPELEGQVAGIEDASPAPDMARATGGIPPGIRAMAAGAFFFSVMSMLVKVAGERLPSQEIVLVRALITLGLSVWEVRRAGVSPWGNNRRLLLVRGLVGFLALSAFYYAIVHLPLADATVIQYTNPIFATLLAVPVLGERLRTREVLLLLVSMAGVLTVTRPALLFGGQYADPLDPLAVGIGLLGAVGSAAAYISVRKLGRTEHPSVIIFYFALVSVIGSFPTALPGAVWPTPTEWVVLFGIGITTQLGQISITHGLRQERAGRATAVAYLQIVFAALWGALFFAEIPDLGTVVGALLIVASTLTLSWGRAARTES